MTNRRSFFKRLALAATAVTVSAKADAPIAPPPPAPSVRSRKAYTTLIVGHEPKIVNHMLNSPLVCAMAGDSQGKARPAVVDPFGPNSCKVTVPKPPSRGFSFFSWRSKKTPEPIYSLVVYVPM